MTNLKEVNFGMNQYCGPAVLSAITGKSTDECAAVISKITKNTVIKAVHITDLLRAVNLLGFNSIAIDRGGYTLFSNLNSLWAHPGIYLIVVPKHVVAVEVTSDGIFLVDNASKEPFRAEASARLTQRVEVIYKLTEKEKPVYLRSELVIEQSTHAMLICIYSDAIYKNPADNTRVKLGQFAFRNEVELEDIIVKLFMEVVKK